MLITRSDLYNLIKSSEILHPFYSEMPDNLIRRYLSMFNDIKEVNNDFLMINPTTNIIYFNDKCYTASNAVWDRLYLDLQADIEYVYQELKNNVMDPEEITAVFGTLDKHNEIPKDYFEKNIKALINHIENIDRKSNIYETLLLLLKQKDAQQALLIYIQFLITQEFRMKKVKNKIGSIPVTYFCSQLGRNILEFFVLQQPLISKIISLYVHEQKHIVLSDNEMIAFCDYVQALLDNDLERLNILYHQKIYFNIEIEKTKTIKDYTILYNLLKNYILSMLFKQIEYNNITFPQLKSVIDRYLEKYKKDHNNNILSYLDFENPLNETLIRMTYLIVECFSKPYSPQYPAFFNIENIKLYSEDLNLQKVIFIEDLVLKKLLDKHSLNSPYLNISNKEFNATVRMNYIHDMIKIQKNKLIHNGEDMHLALTENCYLNNDAYFMRKTINIDALYAQLKYYNNHILAFAYASQEDSFFHQAGLCNCFYDIKPNILELYNTSTLEEKYILGLIVKYGINVNNTTEVETLNKLKEYFKKANKNVQKNNFYYKVKPMYNKIQNQRIFIQKAIKLSIIYSHFRFFIIDHFIDKRSRSYHNTDFLNTQLFPFVKAWVWGYGPHDYYDEKNKLGYSLFRETVAKYIDNPKLRERVMDKSLETYKKEYEEKLLEHIKSYFHNRAILDDSAKSFYDKVFEIIAMGASDIVLKDNFMWYLYPLMKKKNRTFLVHAMILYYLNPKTRGNLAPHYERDASSSGIQVAGIFLKSKQMAEFSNLIGTEPKDPTLIIITQYKEYIARVTIFGDTVASLLFNVKDLNNFLENAAFNNVIHKKEYETGKNNNLYNFLMMNIQESSYSPEIINDVYKTMIDSIFTSRNTNSIQDVFNEIQKIQRLCNMGEDHLWILSKSEKELYNNPKIKIEKEMLNFLLMFRSCVRISHCFRTFDLLNNTKFYMLRIFKFSTMTFFYNSSSYRRKEVFVESLIEFITSYDGSASQYTKILHIASNMDRFFVHFIKLVLKDGLKLFEIRDVLALNNKPINIKNKYFKMRIFPRQYVTKNIPTPTSNKLRGAQLSLRSYIDAFNTEEFLNSFVANLIHSMDAYIVHELLEKANKINEELNNNYCGFSLTVDVTHDCFIINSVPISDLIIKDAYINLAKSTPINWLLNVPLEEGGLTKDVKEKIKHIWEGGTLYLEKDMGDNATKDN